MIEPETKRIQLHGEAQEFTSEIHEAFGISGWSAGFIVETRLFFGRWQNQEKNRESNYCRIHA